eukprot:245981-Rhodomonas_salina.2
MPNSSLPSLCTQAGLASRKPCAQRASLGPRDPIIFIFGPEGQVRRPLRQLNFYSLQCEYRGLP